ncbi:apolipoprotein N-acyltransferase [Thorsellia anophelis]|uniref:Apolipoprotein N-acyltransferase n=1 Tax=Thorsellia anophelis DSM 18579 TaxID=1123402 RepID=A0A1I0BQJ2_9GAMM|nr:apolipoprotein N-acyltransferase [Thorsellia anophelis]SET09277.1 apolipoprotein N-acyltransferase [Thorsellia anophelis DSM 18579]
MKISISLLSKLSVAFIFGALGVLAFAPFDQYLPYNGLLIFASLAGLFFLIETIPNASKTKWIGFTWGLGFFGFGINWVYVSVAGFGGMPYLANLFIVGLLIAYLSLYPALFSYLINKLSPKNNQAKWILLAPIIWGCVEFLRGWVLTGFPWLQIGYSQINLPLRHLAPIFGVEGINIALVILSAMLMLLWRIIWTCISAKQSVAYKNFFILLSGFLLLNLSPLFLGMIKWTNEVPERAIEVTLIQPNIDQKLRWEGQELANIIDKTKQLSLPHIGRSDLIIWPETAIPSIESYQRYFLKEFDDFLRLNNTQLITGLVDMRDNGTTYNAAIVLGTKTPYELPDLSATEAIIPTEQRYFKHHLVPFGETVPLQDIMKHIAPLFNLPMSSFSQGPYISPNLIAANRNFAMAICYEIILGQQLRSNMTKDTDFILTISNDAWFGESTGPWQHLEMARMRALELGRPVLRSTNNGITAIIDANGNITAKLEQFKEGTLTENVSPTSGVTLFAQYGNYINWLVKFFLLVILLLIVKIYRKKN